MNSLIQRLAGWLETVARLLRRRRADRTVLVLGGVRSGKSRHAERLLAGHGHVLRVLPGGSPVPDLPDRRLPAHWESVHSDDLATLLRTATSPLLIDCLGTWVSRVLADTGAWSQEPGWELRLDDRLGDFLRAWESSRVRVVAVSNEVGSDVTPATAPARLFRDVLSSLNNRVAASSDGVHLVLAGRLLRLSEQSLS